MAPPLALLLLAAGAHPYFEAPEVRTVDLSATEPEASAPDVEPRDGLPEGLVQLGTRVVPRGVADGTMHVDHQPIAAVEDIPGNAYPRKHTVFLNFNGADLVVGADNSALNKSTLARQGQYPAFSGSEATMLSAVQAFENDVAAYGIRVRYESRPRNLVPYTMVMIGGDWTDTTIDDPAGGVAPGTDCGALGQRHVVYVFANGGWGGTQIANVSSQEAGHAWGLDHSFNCNSVMAYCGGGDQYFSGSCDAICEEACQGPAGCFDTHEQFCPEGRQNEAAELNWIFGGNEPDMTPPTAEIVEPADGTVVTEGDSVHLRAIVDDDYGGFGWKFILEKDGVVEYDEVDYDRDVDAEYRAALNLVNLEVGEYTLTVEVEDQYEHITTDTVTLIVEAAPSGSDGGGDGGGDDGGGDGGGGTGTGDSGDPTSPLDDDEDDGEDGDDEDDIDSDSDTDGSGVDTADGGCRTGGTPAALPLLLLPLLLRRRRR